MKKFPGTCMAVLVSVIGYAQPVQPSLFTAQTDVGTCKIPGNYQYNAATQEYSLTGSGANMWYGFDDFHFVWKKQKGDFILTTQIKFKGKGTNAHRKIGWMVRHSLEKNAPYADAAVHGDGLTSLQYRQAIDSMTEEVKTTISAPDIIQFERRGNEYIMWVAKYGEPLQQTGSVKLNLGDEVYIGLFICAHEENVLEEAVFSNVNITVPAKSTYVPYKDIPGSRLETIDVATGLRKVIYSTTETIEAPNWLKDGSALLYNSKVLLYFFPFATAVPVEMNTGFAKRNNNDHLLSPDGKLVAISNHGTKTTTGGNSIIHIVSLQGGEPVQVTDSGPSYLHGWSPDGKTLAYCASRNNEYDVYTISVKGGKEKRLTSTTGLDDGPEYSPDGKYIYFNSTRSGSMQVWRMQVNGNNAEQVTDDGYNNWFPHISPDGSTMVFLSFSKEVAASDHPPCKKVMIRVAPVNGSSKPTVLAYVYGGQGTINVPSWSPDSKQLAFVSYTFPDNYYEKK